MLIISIHRPHTRPDNKTYDGEFTINTFQFTGLIRGPTSTLPPSFKIYSYFNSQASYEARRDVRSRFATSSIISIHRPHTRPDADLIHKMLTPGISIHRPHTRPDLDSLTSLKRLFDFNSHAAYEARRGGGCSDSHQCVFQFTGLIRGPTLRA